jgi:hypothetical protein
VYNLKLGLAAAALVAGFTGSAGAATVDSIAKGSLAVLNGNPQVFNTLLLNADANRSNYMVFDLTSLAGQLAGEDVVSATLTIKNPGSFTNTETVNFYDFGGDVSALKNYTFANPPAAGVATGIRDDLRSGDLYGSTVVSVGLSELSIALTAAAIADINNVLDNGGSFLFAIGGFSPTQTGVVNYLFNSSGMAYGELDVVATPLPAALPLFATVLFGGGAMAWRRKRKQAAEAVTA